jgi:hypothetical protein
MNPVGNAWTKLESKEFIRVESAFQSRTQPATAAFCSAPERLLWTGQAKNPCGFSCQGAAQFNW